MNAEALTVEDISKLIECYEERIECAFDAFTKVQDASMVLADYLTEHTPLTGNWRLARIPKCLTDDESIYKMDI